MTAAGSALTIVEFSPGTLRFLDGLPQRVPADGFVWIYLERETLEAQHALLQQATATLGGSGLLDLHVKDLANPAHPSHYDYTSVYDLVVFRRLASEAEVDAELGDRSTADGHTLENFSRIRTRAVGFAVFDRLLVSVHASGCHTARAFIERYLADAVHSDGAGAIARSRLPTSPADLMLRMLNLMVDQYLDLRKDLSTELDRWQQQLLSPRSRGANWAALMAARNALHMLEDLCDEQHDAVQEWLDSHLEQPAPWMTQAERDSLHARARDVAEHINRVVHHVRRMQQSAETAVQIHFSALGNRTNEIMRTLTALTAIFLPLNLMAGIFGMNFQFLPLVQDTRGFWMVLGAMGAIAVALGVTFWRKHYLARTSR